MKENPILSMNAINAEIGFLAKDAQDSQLIPRLSASYNTTGHYFDLLINGKKTGRQLDSKLIHEKCLVVHDLIKEIIKTCPRVGTIP